MPASGSFARGLARVVVAASVVLAAAVLPACTAGGSVAGVGDVAGTTATAARYGLGPERRCAGATSFRCATLTVPLDRSGRQPGTLRLQAGFAGPVDPPAGYLLVLTGGPGQPGVPFLSRVSLRLRPLLADHRVVVLDQRGTGERAIDCARLQEETGGSDITPPSRAAVRSCAAQIGPSRAFYSTADTVGDLDQLRRALGQRSWKIDGISYGTFVAERYALAHPSHVRRMVLDSVVPQDRFEPFLTVPQRATARVLRDVCRAEGCTWDPAKELAREVRTHHDGVELLDALTVFGIVDPTYPGFLTALHEAALGDRTKLEKFRREVGQWQQGTPASSLSAGLHAATACTDGRWPWGTSATPERVRTARYEAAAAALSRRDVWPFDRATAAGNGWNTTCLAWPRMPTAPVPGGRLRVPALLLVGERDLSTPVAWAEREHALAPRSTLVVLPGAGHGCHIRAEGNRGTARAIAYLRG